MSITEEIIFDKNGRIERWPWLRKFFLTVVIVLVALLSFGIGRLSVVEKEPIRIEYDPSLSTNIEAPNPKQAQSSNIKTGQTANVIDVVIGSKNGTRYHYGHCPGTKQIKEGNKIVFSSVQEAEAAGYSLAGNCTPR